MTPVKVEAPVLPPGHCYLCSTHKGPMADTFCDDGIARVYVCERCVGMMARLFGYVSIEEAQSYVDGLAEAMDRITELEQALEDEQANKVVTLSDAIRLADLRAASTP